MDEPRKDKKDAGSSDKKKKDRKRKRAASEAHKNPEEQAVAV